jgi:crotonobetainyl-CoA:carnitine CoA-transferase CaiB-like acyl-CoA transferase
MTYPQSGGALDGLRVLDLTRILAGPFCTQVLGDLGAEVIKVERPITGDDTRHWGPYFVKAPTGEDTRESAYFLSANRNKKSITVDLSKKEGQEVIFKLLERFDVLVENFKPGNMKRFGLDYEAVYARVPRIIYCSITGFGQTGPYSSRPGYDFMIQALAGFMALTGEPGGLPMRSGIAAADLITGLHASTAILAAVRNRDRSGNGQHIDISLLDSAIAALTFQGQNYLTSGVEPQRLGNAHPNIVPYSVFETADGHVVLPIGNDDQFHKFCRIAGISHLITDPSFATNLARLRNRQLVNEVVSRVLLSRSSESWIRSLAGAGVPCSPINTVKQAFANEQVNARGMVMEVGHPSSAAPIQLIASPIRMSDTGPTYRSAPPLLGQDTEEVMQKAGFTEVQIRNLRAAEII